MKTIYTFIAALAALLYGSAGFGQCPPTISPISNYTYCNGAAASAITFSSSSSNAMYAWTSDQDVGFGTSGPGNIPAFTAKITGTAPIIATVTVTATEANCTNPSTATFTVTVNPIPTVSLVPNYTYCNGAAASAIVFSSATPSVTYEWISDKNVGFLTSGNGSISTFTAVNSGTDPVTATVTVTATVDGCKGPPTSFTVTVNPTPTVSSIPNYTYCNGTSNTLVNFSSPTTGGTVTYAWTSTADVGFKTSGIGSIGTFTATNSGTAPVTATVTVSATASGCSQTSTSSFTVTVNPTPVINPIPNYTYCNGATASAIIFSSPTSGATYTWTSTADVGFTKSGTASIVAFMAKNSGTAPVTATVTVTATANGCTGPPTTFTVTVNPTPVVNTVPNYTYCNGSTASAIVFSSPTSGATYTWTSTADVGFKTSGIGSIGTFTATNSGTAPVTATVTVTATANNCIGPPVSFTVAVNPTPTVSSIPNYTYCNGSTASAITFSSTAPGATYKWKSTADVGFDTSGTGSIDTFTAKNSGTAPLTATVTVTATASGCTGPPTTFTVTVNPTPVVNTVPNSTYCNGSTATAITFGSNITTGTVIYTWTSTKDVGFGTGSTGSIPAFPATNSGTATVTVIATANGCTSAPVSFTVTVNPGDSINPIPNYTYCNGSTASAITFSSTAPGATYKWKSTADVGFDTSGTGSIDTFTAKNSGTAPLTATVTVSAVVLNCTGIGTNTVSRNFTVTVNPTPTVSSIPNYTYCNGTSNTLVNFSSPTTGGTVTYAWTSTADVGFKTSGIGSIGTFTATNSGTAPVTATVTVTATANGCTGPPISFTVTVTPKAVADYIPNQTYCNGTMISAIKFTSPISGATYTWTSTADVGFDTSGTGSIPAFTAKNNDTLPVTAKVTVSITVPGCSSSDTTSFLVTVNPKPVITSAIGDSTYCNRSAASAINFSSSSPNSAFTWTSTADVGFDTSGPGSIPAFTATNSGTAPVTATVTATATANGCTGPPISFTITVNPTPKIDPISNYTYCNQSVASAINFSTPSSDSAFTWTSTADVGFDTSGTGSIPAFTATNSGTVPVTATVTVKVSANNNCSDSSTKFTIIVNPIPKLNSAIPNYIYCNGVPTSAITFSSATPGTTFSWLSTAYVGFDTAGNGNSIPADTAVNNDTLPVAATVTVITLANRCSDSSTKFTVTVNPTPAVKPVPNYIYCNGAPMNSIHFSSATPDATFFWKSSTDIGFNTQGQDSITAHTAVNNGSQPVIAKIVDSASANGCTGVKDSFYITVNPTPVINSIIRSSYTYCNGDTIRIDRFTSASPDSMFVWTSTKNVGFGTGSNGSIPAVAAVNNGTLPVTDTVTVRVSANGCAGRDTSFIIIVNPTPLVNSTIQSNYTYCNGAATSAVTFSSVTTGTAFSWTSSVDIGFGTNGKGNSIPADTAKNNSSQPVIATVTVSTLANGCSDNSTKFTVTVNPTPVVNSTILPSYPFCNGDRIRIDTFSSATPGTTFTWKSTKDVGFDTSGKGSIPAATAINNDTLPLTTMVTVKASANGCSDSSKSFAIIVNPTPLIKPVSNYSFCNGEKIIIDTFKSSTPGATFQWTSSPDIGFGTGNSTNTIPSFNAVNTGSQPNIAIVNVNISANKCSGTPASFTVTVNPIPNTKVSTHRSVYCNTDQMDPINFTSSTPNYSYTWTSSVNIGFGPRSTGSIPSVNAVNMGVSPLTTKIVDSVSANGCPGVKDSFNITVNPTPKINPIQNYTYCNKASASAIIFSSPTIGGPITYTWTSTKNIGFGTGNNGSIPAFTAINTANTPVTAKIVVDISANNCIGAKDSFYITVNPTPVITIAPHDSLYCNGASMDAIGFSSATPGATYTWTSTADIGFGTSGGGSIPSKPAVNIGILPNTAIVVVSILANGCTGPNDTFRIIVNPLPFVPVITSLSGINAIHDTLQVCEGATRINFNVVSPPPVSSGISYAWTAIPAGSVTIYDLIHPNTAIDFNKEGYVTIKVTAGSPAVPYCQNSDTQLVSVRKSDNAITYRKIVKKDDNVLIYPDNRISRFQWGYDTVVITPPDKRESVPIPVAGQVYQFFTPDKAFLNGSTLDTMKFRFWVMLYEGSNGDTCATKVYYNGPFDDKPTNNRPTYQDNSIHLTVFPNPNRGTFKVDLQGNIYGTIEAQLYNAAGQLVYRNKFTKTDPAVTKTFITNGLAGGMYYLMLRSSDLKEAHTRFIIIQ